MKRILFSRTLPAFVLTLCMLLSLGLSAWADEPVHEFLEVNTTNFDVYTGGIGMNYAVIGDNQGSINNNAIDPEGIFIGKITVNNGTVITNSSSIETNRGIVGSVDAQGNLQITEDTGNLNLISVNAGKVTDNPGNITTNASGGFVLRNSHSVGTNEKGGEVSLNTGTVGTNEGSVGTNEGQVSTNKGEIETNAENGVVLSNEEGGKIVTNEGSVPRNLAGGVVVSNSNDVTVNAGVVEENAKGGVISNNTGVVWKNAEGGTVRINVGTVGTVNENGEAESGNEGKVGTNTPKGVVYNFKNGLVDTNYGTVYNNGGIVTSNTEDGTVVTNTAGSFVVGNAGTVTDNNANGVVVINQSSGVITSNAGIVGLMDDDSNLVEGTGNLGTIDSNTGVVSGNAGTVTSNNANGVVLLNESDGNITNNSGVIFSNAGTVTDNNANGVVLTNEISGVITYNAGLVGDLDDDANPVEGTGNLGRIDTNTGIVTFNPGNITTNSEGGFVLMNTHSIGTNEEGGEVGLNADRIGINEGFVDTNEGQVGTNKGEIDTNAKAGTVLKNEEGGVIGTNEGTVPQNLAGGVIVSNSNTVSSNSGVVEENADGGVISNNAATGEIWMNALGGTVKVNAGMIGTVNENGEMVSGNEGKVSTNTPNGIVFNLEKGTIETNYGTVYNFGGTVGMNAETGTEYFSVEVINTTTYSESSTSGLTEAYGQQWLGQTGSTVTVATVTITPKEGHEINSITGLADNVTAVKDQETGVWTLTITSGKNTVINVPEATEKPVGMPAIGAPASVSSPFILVTYDDGSQTAYWVDTEPAPANNIFQTPPVLKQASERVVTGTVNSETVSKSVQTVVSDLDENTAAALRANNPVFDAAFNGRNAITTDSGVIDFAGDYADASEESVLVPSQSIFYFVNNFYTVVFSDGTMLQVKCTEPGVLDIPVPKDAAGLGYVVLLGTIESNQAVKKAIQQQTAESGQPGVENPAGENTNTHGSKPLTPSETLELAKKELAATPYAYTTADAYFNSPEISNIHQQIDDEIAAFQAAVEAGLAP